MSGSRTLFPFAALATLWGGSFVAIKVGLDALPPIFFAATRFDVGALVLLGFLAATADDPVPRTAGDRRAVLAGGVFIVALNNAFLFVGQQYVSSGVAAIIYALNPVLTPLFAWFVLDERLGAADAAGFLLAFVGVGLIARPTPGDLSGATVGAAYLLAAAVAVSLGGVLTDAIETRRSTTTITAWSMVVGALALHASSLALGESLAGTDLTPTLLAATGYLGVFATAIAYAVYFDLLDRVGAVEANLVAYVVPVVAALTGWALLDEALTPLAVLGFLVIFLGFALIRRDALRDLLVRAGVASTG